MANPNLMDLTVVRGKTDAFEFTTTQVQILNNPASSAKVLKVESISVANLSSTDNTFTLYYHDQDDMGGNSFIITSGHFVEKGEVSIIDSSWYILVYSFYVEENRSLSIDCTASAAISVCISYEEIS